MAQVKLDTEGLSEVQIQKVKEYIHFLRKSGDKTTARQEIRRLWEKWAETVPRMTDEEAAQIAEEVIAEVRGKKA